MGRSALVAVAIGLLLAGTAPAAAEPAPPPGLEISSQSVSAGDLLELSGRCGSPPMVATVRVARVVPPGSGLTPFDASTQVPVGAGGAFAGGLVVPSSAPPGDYTAHAWCTDRDVVLPVEQAVPLEVIGGAQRSTECFIRATYGYMVQGGQVSDDEVTFWVAALRAGAHRSIVPRTLLETGLWRGYFVHELYNRALDRSPAPEEREYWVGRLRAGLRPTRVMAMVFGSAEAGAHYATTEHDELEHLYYRLLRRMPDAAGRAYWQAQLDATGRGSVAARLLASAEGRRQRAIAAFRLVLDRTPDPASTAYWAERLHTVDDVRIVVHLIQSVEFYRRAVAVCAPG